MCIFDAAKNGKLDELVSIINKALSDRELCKVAGSHTWGKKMIRMNRSCWLCTVCGTSTLDRDLSNNLLKELR